MLLTCRREFLMRWRADGRHDLISVPAVIGIPPDGGEGVPLEGVERIDDVEEAETVFEAVVGSSHGSRSVFPRAKRICWRDRQYRHLFHLKLFFICTLRYMEDFPPLNVAQ